MVLLKLACENVLKYCYSVSDYLKILVYLPIGSNDTVHQTQIPNSWMIRGWRSLWLWYATHSGNCRRRCEKSRMLRCKQQKSVVFSKRCLAYIAIVLCLTLFLFVSGYYCISINVLNAKLCSQRVTLVRGPQSSSISPLKWHFNLKNGFENHQFLSSQV